MKPIAIITGSIILIAIFASCATSFNTKKTSFRIGYDKEIKIVSVEKLVKQDQKDYVLLRSGEELKINITYDSISKTLGIPAKKSLVYWENILNFGIGFLIDNKSIKRYTYPKRIFLEKLDSTVKVVSYPTVKKGTFEISLSLPYANSFVVRTSDGFYSSQGFLGIGIGLQYYYGNNNYISFYGGGSMDHPVPFPVGVDYFREHEEVNISFLSLRNHNKLGRFDFGYGLSFSTSNWSYWKMGKRGIDSTDINLSKQNNCIGLSLIARCHFGRCLSVGIIYQPSFINLSSGPVLDYQDFISLEAAFNLKLRKPRRGNRGKNLSPFYIK